MSKFTITASEAVKLNTAIDLCQVMPTHPINACQDHILAANGTFRAVFDGLRKMIDEGVSAKIGAIEVTQPYLRPLSLWEMAKKKPFRKVKGPRTRIVLPTPLSAADVLAAIYDDALGIHLFASVHKHVSDAAKMTEAHERLSAMVKLEQDTAALTELFRQQANNSGFPA